MFSSLNIAEDAVMHIPSLTAAIVSSGVAALPPAQPFAEASARVDAALDELRIAEAALERQLSDLRGYMTRAGVPAVVEAGSQIQ
jgi:hypothetical protein